MLVLTSRDFGSGLSLAIMTCQFLAFYIDAVNTDVSTPNWTMGNETIGWTGGTTAANSQAQSTSMSSNTSSATIPAISTEQSSVSAISTKPSSVSVISAKPSTAPPTSTKPPSTTKHTHKTVDPSDISTIPDHVPHECLLHDFSILTCADDEYCCHATGMNKDPVCCSTLPGGAIFGIVSSLIVIIGCLVCSIVACCHFCDCCLYRKSRDRKKVMSVTHVAVKTYERCNTIREGDNCGYDNLAGPTTPNTDPSEVTVAMHIEQPAKLATLDIDQLDTPATVNTDRSEMPVTLNIDQSDTPATLVIDHPLMTTDTDFQHPLTPISPTTTESSLLIPDTAKT